VKKERETEREIGVREKTEKTERKRERERDVSSAMWSLEGPPKRCRPARSCEPTPPPDSALLSPKSAAVSKPASAAA